MAVDRQHPAVYVSLRHGVRFARGSWQNPSQKGARFEEQRECPQALLQIALCLCLIPTLRRTAGGVVK